ncbi:MAG: ABC transporter ATP-binding protein [Thermoanaerobaculia bacterium]|jgi:ABC-2 type transport system ATP-binding protein
MIEISHLTKRYGDFVAVDDVSLVATRGEVFGFLGPNGAGKTTTIRIIAGLSTPDAGSVRVNGIDVIADPRRAKAEVGYVPDRPFLYEKLSGWELLRFVSDLYRRDWNECRPRAERLLRYLGLDDWAAARIENYSHGMKQKIVLVSALVHDPRTLVIDEPMVGLDALAQKLVKTLLRELAAEGKAIFLTTHTMSVAEAVCDRIAIINRGKIVAQGTPDEVKKLAAEPGGDLENVFLEITTAPEPQV